MKKQKLFFASGFAFTIFAAVFFSTNSGAAEKNESTKERLEALAKLTKTISTIEKYYVDDVNFTAIVDKSITGLMSNLDAHSSYMDPKSYKDLEVQTKGEFGGLGITVGMKDGALTVIAPIEATPADKAGLKAGDVILRIDGVSTLGITIDEAVSKMRGKPKTPITITIFRQNVQKPFDVKIIRDIIKVQSVYSKMIDQEDILYLRVTNFDQNVVSETEKLIKKQTKAKGIILDLRNNPGGLLDQAVGLTNLFVDTGVIVSQKGRDKAEDEIYNADKNKKISNLPLVVLVNSGSASASEIVSGSLQDHKRAVIVGENTFGKGSVQVILPIDNKEALRLTIARYYLPSGRTIQAVGVKPDIVVYPGKVPTSEDQFSIKETDLKQHLQTELAKLESDKHSEKKVESGDLITSNQVNDDIQLKTAIDSIKVLNIK